MLYGLDDVGKLKQPARTSPRPPSEQQAACRAPEARGAARLLRDHALPAPGAAGLFRRGRCAEPCGNCDVCLEPAGELRRHRAGAQGAVGDLPHRPALRRRPRDRRAARRGATSGSRSSATTACRSSASASDLDAGRMALGAAPARGAGPDRDRRRGPWRPRARPATAAPCSAASAGGAAPRSGAAARPRGKARGRARGAAGARRSRATRAVPGACAQWRCRLATAQGVPPYVIFHDATLLAIARRTAARPRAISRACPASAPPSSSATARSSRKSSVTTSSPESVKPAIRRSIPSPAAGLRRRR